MTTSVICRGEDTTATDIQVKSQAGSPLWPRPEATIATIARREFGSATADSHVSLQRGSSAQSSLNQGNLLHVSFVAGRLSQGILLHRASSRVRGSRHFISNVMLPLYLMRTTINGVAPMRAAATMTLAIAASLAMACHRSPAGTVPLPAAATASVPGDSLMVEVAGGAVVRVKVAGDDAEWQEGQWVTTSAGCKGVLLTEALLLVRLAALSAMELRVPSTGGHEWQPVPLTRVRDGDGCANPAGF